MDQLEVLVAPEVPEAMVELAAQPEPEELEARKAQLRPRAQAERSMLAVLLAIITPLE